MGLIRATIVDAKGVVAATASNNVTFEIVSGPGRVFGVGNGDPTNHQPNQVSWRSAYHGLVRGLVQVTHDASSPAWQREAMRQMDTDGGVRTQIAAASTSTAASPIVVKASSPGLTSGTISIATSTDAGVDGMLAVAAAAGAQAMAMPWLEQEL